LSHGEYTLSFELPGFQTVIRPGIRVHLNVTLSIDIELALAGIEESMTITGAAPVLDVKSTTVGTNFSDELLEGVPHARYIYSAIAQAPGFHMRAYDVGGSRSGTATGFLTYGLTGQTRTLFEGVIVSHQTPGYGDYGSFEDVQITGAGNMADTGGALRAPGARAEG
jgi:hypothetical protein